MEVQKEKEKKKECEAKAAIRQSLQKRHEEKEKGRKTERKLRFCLFVFFYKEEKKTLTAVKVFDSFVQKQHLQQQKTWRWRCWMHFHL